MRRSIASAFVVAYLASLHRLAGYPRVIPLFTATRAHLLKKLRGLDLALTDAELSRITAYCEARSLPYECLPYHALGEGKREAIAAAQKRCDR